MTCSVGCRSAKTTPNSEKFRYRPLRARASNRTRKRRMRRSPFSCRPYSRSPAISRGIFTGKPHAPQKTAGSTVFVTCRLTAGVILNIVYGHRISSYEDRCFQIAENFIVAMKGIARPSLLDVSPLRKSSVTQSADTNLPHSVEKVPPWVPGAWHVCFIEGETWCQLPLFSHIAMSL